MASSLLFGPLAGLLCASVLGAARPESPRLPAWFEPSRTGEVFHSRGFAGSLSIDSRGAWLQVRGEESDTLLRLKLVDARPALLEGVGQLPGRSQAYLGNKPSKWRKDIPQFERVRARQIYPGIDVEYYSTGRFLEYDFIVSPGADPNKIAIRLEGAAGQVVTDNGDLRLVANGIEVLQHRPVAYQLNNGRRMLVDARYRMDDSGEVRFELGGFDRSRELVIDPVFSFSGYFGGTTTETIHATAAAPDGSFWIAGLAASALSYSQDFEPYQTERKGNADAFIAQIVSDGDNQWRVAHFTYLGGDDLEEARAITVDSAGIVYVTGWTLSFNFPLGGNAFRTTKIEGGDRDVFVCRYDPRGGGGLNLTYSTYYGGTGREYGQAIAVDSRGRITVAGPTQSGELPQALNRGFLQPSNRGGVDAFVAQFDPSAASAADTLTVSTFFGGNGSDTAEGVAILPGNRIVIAGATSSTDLPLAGNAYQSERRGGADGYITILDPEKTQFEQLLYATYFGGGTIDSIKGVAADAEGKLWITGYTQGDFPVTQTAWSTTHLGSTDAFVARLDPAQSGDSFVLYSSYYGGSQTDVAYGIAVASPTRVAITGYTNSNDIPSFGVVGAPDKPVTQIVETFVAFFDISQPATGSLAWALELGGAKTDVATGVSISSRGTVFVASYSDSYGLNGIGDDIPGKMNGVGQPTGFFYAVRPDAQ